VKPESLLFLLQIHLPLNLAPSYTEELDIVSDFFFIFIQLKNYILHIFNYSIAVLVIMCTQENTGKFTGHI